ncbi:aminopeptidase P family protein [Paenirhodobacter populi]|uniref:Aminopeptidase P family protein n=1 Tax=Paenirhodobacter populi TaxID=2306993 RepID=A0A443JVQ0_9RHOB|nr:aminopeptidase P family protein [Sinirhodobacter populi]RWR24571.1 aminopeptidase P family protein [Sinirhodobacter populi]
MFQEFSAKTSPEFGAARLAALRAELAKAGLDAFIVPRADAWQGEYVTEADARLAWLTGFTGSAGFCIVTQDRAGVFVDGRYRVQVRAEVDLEAFTPVDWPETLPGPWLAQCLPAGSKVGFDPWLHTRREIEAIATAAKDIALVASPNPVDAIWTDRPAPAAAPVRLHPIEFAGESAAAKRARIGDEIARLGAVCAVLTLPDSISWLLNIRGADVPRNPVVQSFAILYDTGRVALFADPAKFGAEVLAALGPDVELLPIGTFAEALEDLAGPVLVDPASAPLAVWQALDAAGVATLAGADPCILPKARKNPAEIAGMEAAHLRDGVAMTEFLCWLDREGPKGHLTEIDVVTALEGFRAETNALLDISFDTICGAGEHGAIVHYRVNEKTNRPVRPGEILLVDSGAQYIDGTTDITRTVAIGPVPEAAKEPFTRVLRGMITIERARWPKGLAGRDLDALARAPLWEAGLDYDHGTGHGVGAALCVHEGPARISRISEIPLEPGMILSDEPGYYREGAFGIRLENLVLTSEAPELPCADPQRRMLAFRNLTWVPFDTRLISVELLSRAERDWLNAYHAEVLARIGPHLRPATQDWLNTACAPV